MDIGDFYNTSDFNLLFNVSKILKAITLISSGFFC